MIVRRSLSLVSRVHFAPSPVGSPSDQTVTDVLNDTTGFKSRIHVTEK